MALSNDQLFLDRFIEYNKERYSDEPSFVSQLNELTLANVQFSNYRKAVNGDSGAISYLVDMISPGLFIAYDQGYNPADYMGQYISVKVEDTPLTLAELKDSEVEGLYFLQENEEDTPVGVLLLEPINLNLEGIRELVKSSCEYELLDEEITFNEDESIVSIDSRTIIGSFAVHASDVAYYNGDYIHDGTLTY